MNGHFMRRIIVRSISLGEWHLIRPLQKMIFRRGDRKYSFNAIFILFQFQLNKTIK